MRALYQVDVFTTEPYRGNPVAVVLDGTGLSTEEMQRFAHWMNLSETTFVLPPSDAGADYQVRIFTPVAELPFAGHPTLGTCHAWLEAGGAPRQAGTVVQQCRAGLVTLRQTGDGLAFAAPPVLRGGPVAGEMLGWVAVLRASAEAVLAVKPATSDLDLGLVGPYPPGSPQAFEVRAFFPKDSVTTEDPVTGSLNASLAPWLLRTGRARVPYVVSQGTALGRAGRVHVSSDDDGTIWVAGGTVTCVRGQAEL